MDDKMTFGDLGLSEILIEAINKKGFEEPTAIHLYLMLCLVKRSCEARTIKYN